VRVIFELKFCSTKALNALNVTFGNACSFCMAKAPGHKNNSTIRGLSICINSRMTLKTRVRGDIE